MTTQRVTCSYQEVIDLHTESDRVSVIGIHTPTGTVPQQMFSGFYKQFRKFKYLGCSLAMVPAARLPADPLQVSYEAGEPTIDPRDMLNPILFHGCHGDDMGAILNQLYQAGSFDISGGSGSIIGSPEVSRGNSAEITELPFQLGSGAPNWAVNAGIDPYGVYESLYYKALTDKTWLQAHPQRGFRKSGLHPRVYSLVTDRQYLPVPGGPLVGDGTDRMSISSVNVEYHNGEPQQRYSGPIGFDVTDVNNTSDPYVNINERPLGAGYVPQGLATLANFGVNSTYFTATPGYGHTAQSFFTNKTVPLGWLDTYQQVTLKDPALFRYAAGSWIPANLNAKNVDTFKNVFAGALASTWQPASLPRVYMGMIMLPPAYKTEQYYRLVLNHRFAFAGFRGISMQSGTIDETLDVPTYFNANGDTMEVLASDPITSAIGNNPISMSGGVPIDMPEEDSE